MTIYIKSNKIMNGIVPKARYQQNGLASHYLKSLMCVHWLTPFETLTTLPQAERRALESKHEFEHVSKLIKSELARFEEERIEDFRDSLHAFLEGMISRQKDLIEAWENYQQMLLKRVGGGRGLDEDE